MSQPKVDGGQDDKELKVLDAPLLGYGSAISLLMIAKEFNRIKMVYRT